MAGLPDHDRVAAFLFAADQADHQFCMLRMSLFGPERLLFWNVVQGGEYALARTPIR
jgi:hypothetical protein